ncbi:MAG TPA: baseplate protein [Nitrososphaerales archaeon]|nr:baseplate protein [Nitrososphaerales archaeon]
MTLPTINVPTYELEVPSTKEKITYRPFLVKEEKILLAAMETGEGEGDLVRALKQIVTNCLVTEIDIDHLATFDLEYIFLNLRSKSVGEVAKVTVICPDDEETEVSLEIPLDEIKVTFPEGHTNKVQITDTIGMTMKYPDFTLASLQRDGGSEYLFEMIKGCIAQITDGETIYERVDFNDKELDTFIDSLNTKQLEGVQTFFETMPKLRHEVKVTNPKTKKKSTITLEGLDSFFA